MTFKCYDSGNKKLDFLTKKYNKLVQKNLELTSSGFKQKMFVVEHMNKGNSFTLPLQIRIGDSILLKFVKKTNKVQKILSFSMTKNEHSFFGCEQTLKTQ